MNSKTEQLLAIAQQFEQDTEDAEASLLADILRIVAEKNFSDLIGLRDRMIRDEDPSFHPFRLDLSRVSEEEKQRIRTRLKEGRTVFFASAGKFISPDRLTGC